MYSVVIFWVCFDLWMTVKQEKQVRNSNDSNRKNVWRPQMKSWSNYSHNCIWPMLPNDKKLLFITNQRIRTSVRLGGTSGVPWFNLQLTAGAVLRSDQAAQVFIHSGIWNLQGQKLHSLLRQPVPLPDCVNGKITLLITVVTLSSFHSCFLSLTLLPMWWAQFYPVWILCRHCSC